MKQSEEDIILNHDIMASFLLHTLPWIPQILGKLGSCDGKRVQPYSFETAYQWLNHFLNV